MTRMKKDSLMCQLADGLSQFSQARSILSILNRIRDKIDRFEQISYAEATSSGIITPTTSALRETNRRPSETNDHHEYTIRIKGF